MYTFDHITETTYEAQPANLPDGAKVSQASRKGKTIWLVHQTERLTVPTTQADLVAVSQSDVAEVEMRLGVNNESVKMTQACADYIRGRKLRSNQEQQAKLRGDGKESLRVKVMQWMVSDDTLRAEYLAALQAAKEPKQLQAYLDSKVGAYLAATNG